MSSGYAVSDEQAAVFLAALIIEKNGKLLRVSSESVHKASQAAGIKARDVFLEKGEHEVELKIRY